MYWDTYYDCLETKTHLDCGTAMFEPPTPRPGEVTPGRVEEAVRRIGLPALVTHVQPETRTLVNVDTIVYSRPAPFDTTVPILNHSVRIHAIPTTYIWHFGDGTTTTTTDPGAPWPHHSVTHRYQHTADAVPITLTVGYHVSYSTDGTPWEDLEQPIYATGPATTVTVDEAHAILIAP